MDLGLARLLGLGDSAREPAAVDLAQLGRSPRLELGGLQVDQVSPVLTVDAGVVRRVTGRPVLGLIGQGLLDDPWWCWTTVGDAGPASVGGGPGEAHRVRDGPVPGRCRPVPARGDGKALVRARVPGPRGARAVDLNLILDTGATKTVLFRSASTGRVPGWTSWPALRGLGAPTLTGDADAVMVRVP